MARTLKEANEEIEVLKRRIGELEELTLDDLTGLPRRKVFQAAVEEEILRCKRSKKSFSILVVDLNYLKTVNDTYGHRAGDQMIVSFSMFLRKIVRDCDIVARTGGDEFMIFLPDLNKENVVTVKHHLLQMMEEEKTSLPFFRGAAIGISTFGETHQSFDIMYEEADRAMYQHKRAMKKCA